MHIMTLGEISQEFADSELTHIPLSCTVGPSKNNESRRQTSTTVKLPERFIHRKLERKQHCVGSRTFIIKDDFILVVGHLQQFHKLFPMMLCRMECDADGGLEAEAVKLSLISPTALI